MPQDKPEEDGEKDEAGEVEIDAFKKALDVQASYSGTTSYGVSFKHDLTKLKPDLKPNEDLDQLHGTEELGLEARLRWCGAEPR
ncbi:MAG: hypothetical protein QM736_03620 [Vicinamibacterales bacterium]